MNILKKILGFIFNPLNSVSFGKATEKLVATFTKHPILIFLVSLVVSAIIFLFVHGEKLF
jgi:hypothetical protein